MDYLTMDYFALAQVVGISSSFWLSGEIFTYSYGAVPAALIATPTSPSLAAKQWAKIYQRGHAVGPAVSLLGAGIFSWLALQSQDWLYWGAAALEVGIIPWTLIFMVKTNNGIFEVANADSTTSTAQDAKGLKSLLNKWSSLNTIRSMFPFAGGILALVASLT